MICAPVLLSVLPAASARPSVRLVAVEGNCRIPAATVRHYVSARPGAPCNEESMREDIRRLHALGVFREAEGDAGAAAAEVRAIIASVEVPRLCDDGFLESVRRKLGEALGRNGYALAQVHLIRSDGDEPASVRALFRIYAGDPVLTGRIVFVGNSRVPDRFLRRELRLAEGRLFNTHAQDENLIALNRSGLIEEIARDDVRLEYDRESNTVDVLVHVRERGRQGIYATGGTAQSNFLLNSAGGLLSGGGEVARYDRPGT